MTSSSPDETVAGAVPTQILEDSRVHQELLHRVAQNMTEDVVKGADPMVDILALEGLSRVALLLI